MGRKGCKAGPVTSLKFFFVLLLGAGFLSFGCLEKTSQPSPKITSRNGNKKQSTTLTLTTQGGRILRVQVEFARTPSQQQKGLMFRQSMDENAGMLFIFPDDQIRTFWMKNTLIPLDMIFIDRNKQVVGIVQNAEPRTLSPRSVPHASRYVLEVNGGFCAKKGVQAGDKVEFEV